MSGEFSPAILERFRSPSGAGPWPAGTPGVRVGRAADSRRGALLELHLRRRPDGRFEARFLAVGPPALIAAGAWLSTWIDGREGRELSGLAPGLVERELELPADCVYCAVLCQRALERALQGASGPTCGRGPDSERL